jgi:hypothetical protein
VREILDAERDLSCKYTGSGLDRRVDGVAERFERDLCLGLGIGEERECRSLFTFLGKGTSSDVGTFRLRAGREELETEACEGNDTCVGTRPTTAGRQAEGGRVEMRGPEKKPRSVFGERAEGVVSMVVAVDKQSWGGESAVRVIVNKACGCVIFYNDYAHQATDGKF